MYASFIKGKFKPGSRDDLLKAIGELEGDMKAIPGFCRLTNLDFGDDSAATVVIYESKEAWEAAAPRAQEIMAQLAPYFAEMPERIGAEVSVDF